MTTTVQPPPQRLILGVPAARIEHDARTLAAAVAAGIVVGFVVNGWGSRFAMMLLARMNPEVTGRLSDDGFVMGHFVLGDTLGLVAFGTVVGALGGLIYLAIRPLRLGPTWFQSVGLFVGPAVVVGSMLVHTDGVDFRILDPAGLAVALFVVLPGLFALALSVLVDRWSADGTWFFRAPRWQVLPLLLPLFVIFPLAIMTILGWLALLAFRGAAREGVDRGAPVRWAGRAGLVVVFGFALVRLISMTVELT